jgi:hypothetical protein
LQLSGKNFVIRSIRLSALESSDAKALVSRMAPEVMRTVLHFQHHCDMPNPVRVMVSGDGAPQEVLGIALEEHLKIPAQKMDVGAIAEFAPEATCPNPPLGLIELVGAASAQLRPAQAMLNLLPPRLRTQQRRRHRQCWLSRHRPGR